MMCPKCLVYLVHKLIAQKILYPGLHVFFHRKVGGAHLCFIVELHTPPIPIIVLFLVHKEPIIFLFSCLNKVYGTKISSQLVQPAIALTFLIIL